MIDKSAPLNDDESVRAEVAILRRLRHASIVGLVEVFDARQKLWIVMECCAGGELLAELCKHDHGWTAEHAARASRQLLGAVSATPTRPRVADEAEAVPPSQVSYIHERGVVHRDIKLPNLLLTHASMEHGDVKLADFGLAAAIASAEYSAATPARRKAWAGIVGEAYWGTPLTMAPEVMRDDAAYGPQCDVWSCGTVVHALLSGYGARRRG